MRLGQVDRSALAVWTGWRVGVAVLGLATAGLLDAGRAGVGFVERWYHWDVVHYVGIARYGYAGEPTGVPNEAFLPGLPLLMRAGAGLGVDEVVVGLLVSLVASAVAAVSMARLAERLVPGVGRLSVLVWLLAPTAVFLAAPYTEALFVALALPAVLAAQDRRWWLAGVLTATAATVRVSALFLLAALVVQWWVDGHRRLRDLAWLALPAVPIAWIVWAQQAATGSWLAWWDAQRSPEWSRGGRPPWETVQNTWDAAFAGTLDEQFVWPFRLELVAFGLGLVATAWCLRRRWWPEATFVGLSVGAFSFSYWLLSVPRSALLWWPLWVGVATLLRDRPWLRALWVGTSASLAVVVAVTFFSGRWAG